MELRHVGLGDFGLAELAVGASQQKVDLTIGGYRSGQTKGSFSGSGFLILAAMKQRPRGRFARNQRGH
jgi:hypothetical protein